MKLLFRIMALFLFVLILISCQVFPGENLENRVFLPVVTRTATPTLTISRISDNSADYPGSQIPQFDKVEITFQVDNTVAQNFQLPYDPNPPNGLDLTYPKHNGISVDAMFLPPGEDDWDKAYHQPAFYYQFFDDQIKRSWDGTDMEWFYPTGEFSWKARFSPHLPGTWQYKLTVQDAGGVGQSSPLSFTVVPLNNDGFLKVSPTDPRYFEYDSAEPFQPLGYQSAGSLNNSLMTDDAYYQRLNQNGINLIRHWISNIYGTAWLEWLGGRNEYNGYLPRPGVEPFHDSVRNRDTLTLRLDYETDGDTGWYDACRFQFWNDPEAVKPNTDYLLRIKYWGNNISGPRIQSSPEYGLVGKIGGGWQVNCYEPGTSTVITNYGGNTSDWGNIEGTWNSGDNNFLPRIYIGLENVIEGKVNIYSISLREVLSDGQYGPEVLREPSMEYELYFPEQDAYVLDKIVSLAEKSGVYLKLVIMEKGDSIYVLLDDDGTFIIGGEEVNLDGFYGLGRDLNKTRWLQQAWWRYLQARWGYSSSIHSWEATNEGDPWLTQHYELTDEFGKFMHCRVFGVEVPEGEGQTCNYNHPDKHMVTTSFWHSFPGRPFWKNENYPNVDYADLHAYISTSLIGIPGQELEKMQWDAAYYHVGHSIEMDNWVLGKPVIRGEAGIDSVNQQREQPDLALDLYGVWLHNFLWSTLDPGALTELYWWRENLENQPGPDGQPGLHEVYRYLSDFIKNIPLNNGHYVDIQAMLTDPNLRVVGQKDKVNNRAHMWVQNKNHTWRNVVDEVGGISGLAGTLAFDGFSPNTSISVEWFEFTTEGTPLRTQTTVTSDASGRVLLDLPSNPEITDTGIKIGEYTD